MTIPESKLNSGRANEPKPSPELERLANIAYLLNVTQTIDSSVDRGITLGKEYQHEFAFIGLHMIAIRKFLREELISAAKVLSEVQS